MHGSVIMCKRVSTKHSVKNDFAFISEHAIFRHLPNENPLTDGYEIAYFSMSAGPPNSPKMVKFVG
jgi:hypothetical protein